MQDSKIPTAAPIVLPRRADRAALEAFIKANTRLTSVPHVPSISLHLADEAVPLWRLTEEELGEIGLPPPYWAFAWAGGQALARYILDYPELVRGKRVIDLGAGSGLAGIAAAKAGAMAVLCVDVDCFAIAATTVNAEANGVKVTVTSQDLLDDPPPEDANIVLAGDVCYEKPLAERVTAWLMAGSDRGAQVLIGDPGRSYMPRGNVHKIAEYSVPVSRELEDAEVKRTAVWTLTGRIL